jgi:hypothetical protein
MKERPILFSGEMMRAILDGRKGQTRRIIKPQPPPKTAAYSWLVSTDKKRDGCFVPRRAEGDDSWTAEQLTAAECGPPVRCPYGVPGDALWCREAIWLAHYECDDGEGGLDEHGLYVAPSTVWAPCDSLTSDGEPNVYYVATDDEPEDTDSCIWRKRPSIHMPRWASRVTLEVTEVRAERLQSITVEDIIREGFGRDDPRTSDVTLRSRFAAAWEAMHGVGSWNKNDWLWVVSFEVVSQPKP